MISRIKWEGVVMSGVVINTAPLSPVGLLRAIIGCCAALSSHCRLMTTAASPKTMRENATQLCEFNPEYRARQRESFVIMTGSAPSRIPTNDDKAKRQVAAAT